MYMNNNIIHAIKITFFCIPILFFFNMPIYSAMEIKDTHDTLTITQQDNGDTFTVAPETVIMLQLEATPGTGYGWYAKSSICLNRIEEPVFLPNQADTANILMGAPTVEVFFYRAIKEGLETLQLSYMRQWEKDKPPLKTFSITLRIKK